MGIFVTWGVVFVFLVIIADVSNSAAAKVVVIGRVGILTKVSKGEI